MNEHQRKGPTNQEPLPQPHERSEVERTVNTPRRVERDALHSSHQQPVQPDPQHHALSPSPDVKALPQQASLGEVPAEHVLMTTSDVARWFKVTERTVEAWRAKRLLPYRKIGRTIRFKLSDLLQALDDRILVKRRQ
jgi:excisionase family DNA binding protein